MTEQAEAVLEANARFYRAFSLADVSAMRPLWLNSPEASCVHPGWSKLTGFDAILQSWTAIFVNQGPMHVWPSEPQVEFEGDLAWVTCIENVDASATEAHRVLQVKARNAFCREAGAWKLIHHWAEPILEPEPMIFNSRLALN